jgi:hypothetical protein
MYCSEEIAGTGPGFRIRYGGTLHYGQVGSPSNPELYGNSRTASGDSRKTLELGRVEWSQNNPLALVGFYQNLYHHAPKAEFSRSHRFFI